MTRKVPAKHRAGETVAKSKKKPSSATSSKSSCKGTRDKYNSKCPSPSCKSESVSTASPKVLDWLRKHDPRGTKAYNRILGKNGGGGFIQGATTVITLKKGTKIVRYWGGDAPEVGGWWARRGAQNPIRDMALPPNNTALNKATGELKHDVEVLSGPGAPRCSNKPGGPKQYYLPYPAADHVKVV